MNISEKKLLNNLYGNAANNYANSWLHKNVESRVDLRSSNAWTKRYDSWINKYVDSEVDPTIKAWSKTPDYCETITIKNLKSLVGDYEKDLKIIDEIKEYCRRDVMMTYEVMARSNIFNSYLGIEKVIFNDPATIVLWKDGTKTIVKCTEADTYDEEKGLAMAIIKKLYGNNDSFHKIFKKNVPNNDTKHEESALIKEDVSLKIGDTVSIYDSKKYDGIFNGKQGTIKVIRSYRDHVCVGLAIDDYWNSRQINGYYLFDIRKLRKVTK